MSRKIFKEHDHTGCVLGALTSVMLYCTKNGLRFTTQRRKVLEILLAEHKAMGAYDIMARLKEAGTAAKPPTVYRALDFLMTNGFAHKIEKLNAYIACAHPGQDHAPAFMICRNCEKVAETRAARRDTALHDAADTAGFQIEETVVEAQGLCPGCKEETTS